MGSTRSGSIPPLIVGDIFEYEIGNEPAYGRAAFHGTMDLLTLGVWEIIGTPIEASAGKTSKVTVVYDEDDTAYYASLARECAV